jgi:hypothetical protein
MNRRIGLRLAGLLVSILLPACQGGEPLCRPPAVCTCSFEPGCQGAVPIVSPAPTGETCSDACRSVANCILVDASCGSATVEAPVDVSVELAAEAVAPPATALDLLLVVDESSSMCQEQMAIAEALPGAVERLVAAGIDLRMAVTTTNVCAADKEGAVRGRFVYRPAEYFNPSCRVAERRTCLDDSQCGPGWTCDTAPNASAAANSCRSAVDGEPSQSVVAPASSCRFECDPQVVDACAGLGDPALECVAPGGDLTQAGCMPRPPADGCPEDGPKVIDSLATATYVALYRQGKWAGDAAWVSLDDAALTDAVMGRLAACAAVVGTNQVICANQEQGLLAAWMALDPEGENAEQASVFLRPDAALAVVVVSDEDDCSTEHALKYDYIRDCPCLVDGDGCPPHGPCASPGDPAKALRKVSELAGSIRGLKSDPARAFLAVLAGDVMPGSATTPGSEIASALAAYYDCRCNTAYPWASNVYTYQGGGGLAEYGARYRAATELFGPGHGFFLSVCAADGVKAQLDRLFDDLINNIK